MPMIYNSRNYIISIEMFTLTTELFYIYNSRNYIISIEDIDDKKMYSPSTIVEIISSL